MQSEYGRYETTCEDENQPGFRQTGDGDGGYDYPEDSKTISSNQYLEDYQEVDLYGDEQDY